MKSLLPFFLGLVLPFTGLANSSTFQTQDGKTLQHPRFVKVYEAKAVVVHDEGVAFLEPTTEVITFFNIKPPEASRAISSFDRKKVENWLIEIEKNARGKAPIKTVTPTPTPRDIPTPEPVKAEVTLQTSFTANAFSKAYESSKYDGKTVQISGTVTAIFGAKTPYTIILDDVISFIYNSNEKVKARDMQGNPKNIGSISIGGLTSANGTCQGVDQKGYIIIMGSNTPDSNFTQ